MNPLEFFEFITEFLGPSMYTRSPLFNDGKKKEEIPLKDVLNVIKDFIAQNKELEFSVILKSLTPEEAFVLSAMSALHMASIHEVDAHNLLKTMYKSFDIKLIRKKTLELFSKNSNLIKKELIEIVHGYFYHGGADFTLKLSSKISEIIPEVFADFPVKNKFQYNPYQYTYSYREPDFYKELSQVGLDIKKNIEADKLILDRDVRRNLDHFVYLAKAFIEGSKDTAIALFYGPPGTGKSLSGMTIAKEINRPFACLEFTELLHPLYGITEQKFSFALSKAQEKKIVLQLDEADSLVTKRNTFFSGTLTNSALQKIEDYKGILIITTNLFGNIDNAIMRRIDYIIHFPIPEEKTREKLWKYYIKKEKIKGQVDFKKLAKVKIAGGEIKKTAKRVKISVDLSKSKRIKTSSIEKELPPFAVKKNIGKIGFI